MDPEIKAAFESLAGLIEDTSQSLQGEFESKTGSLRSDMRHGFDRVEAATRRNTTLIAGGTTAIVALERWAASRDKLDSRRDREISDLRARLQRVERALKRKAS